MKKLINKIITPILIVGSLAPSMSLMSSCSEVEIKKITLNFRPKYICPGKSIQIHANLQPEEASQKDVKWEIVDPPIEGFTITNSGKLIAPETFVCEEPKTLHIKASYVKDETINAVGSVLIVESDEDNFLGFTDDQVEHLDRSGENVIYTNIVKNKTQMDDYTTVYETENPIDVFAGRSTDYVKFNPVFKPGYNTRMSFHIYHAGDDTHHCLDWDSEYDDGDWTETIPRFIPLTPAYKTDEIHVTFYSAPTVIFIIRFNVYQQPIYTTSGVFSYIPDGQEWSDKHSIQYNGLGSYSSHLLCPITKTDERLSFHMGDIYCYRKPYEYLDFDKIVFNTEDQDQRIKEAGLFEIGDLRAQRTSLPWFEEGYYPAYKFSLEYKVDCSKIDVVEWEYDPMYIGTIYAYDSNDHSTSVCRLDFWIEWLEEEGGK